MRVSFFTTCLADQFFADEAVAGARLLERLGVDVRVSDVQTCCGQPANNAGYPDEARVLARHALRVFDGPDPVVLPSGSCAAMLRAFYPELMEGEPEADSAVELGRRTWELSEFIVRVLGIRELGTGLRGRRVAYHHGCHALRELGVREEPIVLLEGAGAKVVEWEADEECCGFGGLFAVKMPEISAAMADRKLDTLPPVDFLTSADGGCLLQLGGRLENRGEGVRVRHLAGVLLEGAGGDT